MGYVRNGMGTVRPYVYGPHDLLEFVERAFGAEMVERVGDEVALRVGDSMLALTLGNSFPAETTTRASIVVYVDDADAAYQRALGAGGTAVAAPVDKPYDERMGGVRDAFGNLWWITTYVGD